MTGYSLNYCPDFGVHYRAHSDEAFVNINNAQSSSEKGDKNGTIKAIEATEKQLIQEQKVDLKIK